MRLRTREALAVDRARWRVVVLAAALVLATIVAYLPVLGAGFIWDDEFYVTDNDTLHDLGGLRRIWLETDANPQYYPVTFTSLWIDHHLFGVEPAGYHLVNVLLHAGSAVLLWFVLRRIGVPGAWLGAAIFALHPVQVESVAWVTERKNTLSGFLYLASALSFLRFALPRPEDRRGSPKILPWISLGFFVCALLGKSVVATLPLALALVIFWKVGRLERAHVVWLAVMLALGASMGLLTSSLESRQVGAQGEAFDFSLVERSLIAGRALWFYLGKILWPLHLSFVYPKWRIAASDPIQFLYPAAAVLVLVALFVFRRRLSTGPLVAFVYFAVTLGPALGFVNFYPMQFSFVADHFQYLAAIGPIAWIAATLARDGDFLRAFGIERIGGWNRLARKIVVAVLLFVLGGLTWSQSKVYRDQETLWRATLAENPAAWMAHYNLGKLLEANGNTKEAAVHYRQALEARPDWLDALMNLANLTAAEGKVDEAIPLYRRVLEKNPSHPFAHYNLALALETKGEVGEAIEEYREVLRIVPDPTRLPSALLERLFRQGDFARLIESTQAHLAGLTSGSAAPGEAPSRPDALVREANALAEQGRLDLARARYEQALRLDPDHALAHYNLGIALEAAGEIDEAIRHYRIAIEKAPQLAGAHNNLAILLFRTGDYPGSWREVHRSRRLGLEPHPDFLKALSEKQPDPGS